MIEIKNYNAKGYITFVHTQDGVKYLINEKKDILEPYNGEDFMNRFSKPIYSLYDGKVFYDYVQDGYIIDYDGSLSTIFVDGYISNLGLSHKDFCQGEFLVDGETFLDICENYKVEVNWANK